MHALVGLKFQICVLGVSQIRNDDQLMVESRGCRALDVNHENLRQSETDVSHDRMNEPDVNRHRVNRELDAHRVNLKQIVNYELEVLVTRHDAYRHRGQVESLIRNGDQLTDVSRGCRALDAHRESLKQIVNYELEVLVTSHDAYRHRGQVVSHDCLLRNELTAEGVRYRTCALGARREKKKCDVVCVRLGLHRLLHLYGG
jgi:hypothetical protein